MAKTTRGRRKSGAFVMVLHSMMKSAAWHDLSGVAVKLLLHLMMLSKGNNGWGHKDEQGELFLSERDAAAAIGVSRNTVSRAFEELIDHGFLRTVRQGHFQVKVKIATVWRLTFEPYPRASQSSTNEWRGWQPEQKSRAQKLNGTGAKIGHKPEKAAFTGAIIGPAKTGNGGNAPTATGPVIEPHLDIPREGGDAEPENGVGWWAADASVRTIAVLILSANVLRRQAG
jgi:hypothetical protein